MLAPSLTLWILNKQFDIVGYTFVHALLLLSRVRGENDTTLKVCLCANNETENELSLG